MRGSIGRVLPVIAAILTAIVLTNAPARAYDLLPNGELPTTSPDISIRYSSPFDLNNPTCRGMFPLDITIRNGTDTAKRWVFQAGISADGYSVNYTRTMEVAARTTGTFGNLLPAPFVRDPSRFGVYRCSLELSIAGDGIDSEPIRRYSVSASSMPSLLLSQSFSHLDRAIDEAWKAAPITKTSEPLERSFAAPKDFPTDWRAYTAFDQVWKTQEEWTSLGEAQRQALVDWVGAGGHLVVVTSPAHPLAPNFLDSALSGVPSVASLQLMSNEVAHYLAGQLTILPLDLASSFQGAAGAILNRTASQPFNNDLTRRYALTLDKAAPIPWEPMLDSMKSGLPVSVVLPLLILFCLVSNPIAIQSYWRRNRRYHPLIVLPVLSLGASLAVGVLSLFHSGTGTRGSHRALAILLPGHAHRALLTEEHIVSAGWLTNDQFAMPQNALLLANTPAPFLNISRSQKRSPSRSCAIADGHASGAFFDSNTTSVVATQRYTYIRGEVEVRRTQNEWQVRSSLPYHLSRIIIRLPSPSGPATLAEASDLPVGTWLPLEQPNVMGLHRLNPLSPFHDQFYNSLTATQPLLSGGQLFLGITTEADDLFTPLLPETRWTKNRLTIIGQVKVQESATNAEEGK